MRLGSCMCNRCELFCPSDSDDKTVTNVSPSKIPDTPLSYLSCHCSFRTVAFYGAYLLNSGRRPGEVQVIVFCCHKEIVLWWKVKNWTGEHSIFTVRFHSVWIMPGSVSVCQGSCTKVSLPVWFTAFLISTCATVYWVYVSQSQSSAFVCYTQTPKIIETPTQKRTGLPLALMALFTWV